MSNDENTPQEMRIVNTVPWLYAELKSNGYPVVYTSHEQVADAVRYELERGCETAEKVMRYAELLYNQERAWRNESENGHMEPWEPTDIEGPVYADDLRHQDYMIARATLEYQDNGERVNDQLFVLKRHFRGPWFVLAGSQSQCYGGPEEGGWWYSDTVYNRWTMCRTEEEANALCNALRAQAKGDKVTSDDLSLLGLEESSVYPEGYIPTGWSSRNKPTFTVALWPVLGSTLPHRPVYE